MTVNRPWALATLLKVKEIFFGYQPLLLTNCNIEKGYPMYVLQKSLDLWRHKNASNSQIHDLKCTILLKHFLKDAKLHMCYKSRWKISQSISHLCLLKNIFWFVPTLTYNGPLGPKKGGGGWYTSIGGIFIFDLRKNLQSSLKTGWAIAPLPLRLRRPCIVTAAYAGASTVVNILYIDTPKIFIIS